MDFVAVMVFTQPAFHLECLFFFWFLLILEIVIISDQVSAWLLTKVLLIEEVCNVLFKSSKNEEITLPHEFILCLSKYCQKGDVKRGGGREGEYVRVFVVETSLFSYTSRNELIKIFITVLVTGPTNLKKFNPYPNNEVHEIYFSKNLNKIALFFSFDRKKLGITSSQKELWPISSYLPKPSTSFFHIIGKAAY